MTHRPELTQPHGFVPAWQFQNEGETEGDVRH